MAGGTHIGRIIYDEVSIRMETVTKLTNSIFTCSEVVRTNLKIMYIRRQVKIVLKSQVSESKLKRKTG